MAIPEVLLLLGGRTVEKKPSLYRNAKVVVIAFDSMLIMLGFGIVAPSLSYYLIALEGGIMQPPGPGYIVPPEVVARFSVIFGVMMAAFMATRTLLARYWGGMSDKHGRKKILIIGLLGYVILLVLFGLAQNWIHLLLIRAFQGVVSAMVWPVAEAALMDIVGKECRGEGLGVYMTFSNVGFIVGPGLGGLLYNFCRDVLLLPVPDVFRVPYFIAAIIVIPAAVVTMIVLDETVHIQKETETPVDPDIDPLVEEATPIIPADRQRMIHALYIMSLVNGIAMGLGFPLFQLFLMSKITTDIGLIGLVISGSGAVGMLFSIPSGRYSDKYGRKRIAVGGAVISRLSLAALPFTTNLAETSVVWITQNAAMSSSQPAIRAIQADIIPWELRGKLFGTIQAFFNAGATLGPLLGGALYAAFSLILVRFGPIVLEGIIIPFWLASVLGIFGAMLLQKYVAETLPSLVVTKEEPEGYEVT